MPKRIVTTLLWLAVGWTLGSMLTFFVGFPSGVDLALSVALGGIVWWDPTGRMWAYRRQSPTTYRTNEGLPASRLAAE